MNTNETPMELVPDDAIEDIPDMSVTCSGVPEVYGDDADISEHQWDLTFARTAIGITMRDEGTCRIEESVYGAAILMPQLARTSRWNKTMTMLAFQSFLFLAINIFLQAYLLKMLAKEEVVMDGYAGQMFLCDFGKGVEDCPGPGCRGPLGTDITGPRMYSWGAIVDRLFVKDSLKALFPDRVDEINDKVDPGEYGVESYQCRYACCFIFMIALMAELEVIYKIAQLLWKIPTKSERWIRPRPETGSKLIGAVDEVQVKIRGMPLSWKLLNTVVILFPKILLWKLTAETGMNMLMDTSGIDSIITNSVALTFILGIDELMGEALMSEEALNFVKATEDFELFDDTTSCVGDMSLLTEVELLQKFRQTQHGFGSLTFSDLTDIVPTRLLVSVIGTCYFVWGYYRKHCVPDPDGTDRYVSKTLYQPKHLEFSWLNALLPIFFPVETGPKLWEYDP